MNRAHLFPLILIAAAALTACATPTPYVAAVDGGYGFSSQKIEDDRVRVSFRGNALTDRLTVETYLLYHAAQVTLANGYDHFIVTKDDTEKSTRYSVVPDAGLYSYYGFGRPFPYYGYGYRWAPYLSDPMIRTTERYSAVAYISLGRGEKPADTPAAYDAAEVRANLASAIMLSDQTAGM